MEREVGLEKSSVVDHRLDAIALGHRGLAAARIKRLGDVPRADEPLKIFLAFAGAGSRFEARLGISALPLLACADQTGGAGLANILQEPGYGGGAGVGLFRTRFHASEITFL